MSKVIELLAIGHLLEHCTSTFYVSFANVCINFMLQISHCRILESYKGWGAADTEGEAETPISSFCHVSNSSH